MVTILGIETSCDETAAAVVADGRLLLSNVIASQIELHQEYGGVFPEVASRQHVLAIVPVIRQAMEDASVTWEDLDAIAVVYGPGLAGSLSVGLNAAKALSWAQHIPLVGVNHLEAHIYANWLAPSEEEVSTVVSPSFPLVCLIVSGGHTDLILMREHHDYQRLGGTTDDAAGEAFDKVARLLGLGYPGGPAIEAIAEKGNSTAYRLPRSLRIGAFDFSFSGLKTAVLRLTQEMQRERGVATDLSQKMVDVSGDKGIADLPIADIAASFQAAVVDVLVQKTSAAVKEYSAVQVLIAGGVAANKLLRAKMVESLDVTVRYPPIRFCTDNAAMVAVAGYHRYLGGKRSSLALDIMPSLKLV